MHSVKNLFLGSLLLMAGAVYAGDLPSRARIVYEARLSGLPVGQANQTWVLSKNHFQLDTEIVPIFGPRIRYQSSGETTESGIKPASYAEYRNADTTPRQRVNFDWQNHTVSFGNGDGMQSGKLEAGAQDLNTLPFQLSWLGGKGNANLQIITGRKLRSDRFIPGESSSIKMAGKPTPARIWRTADTDDGIEIWLAPEYANLPVKIIRHDDRGEIQLVARTIEYQQE